MMTSSYEGWGITLTEAQQMGVVPIAFHSYASLPEIIDDGRNGLIIPDKDEDAYVEKLLWLMDHRIEREAMAVEAIRSSRRFTREAVGDRWMALFGELVPTDSPAS